MHANAMTIRDVNMSSNVNEFAEDFDEMMIISVVDLLSEYDQITLNERDRDMTVIQTSLELLRQTTILQDEINSVTQFVRIIEKILQNIISKLERVFIDDVDIKDSRDNYNNKKIMSDVRQFVLKHLQNLNKTLYLIELADDIVSVEKFYFLMSDVRIVE